nr:MASE4 domain-containing protein [Burkholderia pyrrocinia]
MALQLLTFPGVFTPTGLLGAGPHSAAWLWIFWHGGFPFFVILSVSTRYQLRRALVSTSHVGRWCGCLLAAPSCSAPRCARSRFMATCLQPSIRQTLGGCSRAARRSW